MFANNRKADGTYRYFDPAHPIDPDNEYAYQSLAVNLRGFKQNISNGNNAMVINSEVRIPVFSSFINKPINNAFCAISNWYNSSTWVLPGMAPTIRSNDPLSTTRRRPLL